MMAVGADHVVTFYEHPRLVSLRSGKVVHEGSELDSGKLVSSIVHEQRHAVLQLDPVHRRFALPAGHDVNVVTIDVTRLPL